jgi:hypothetical protein
MTRGRLGLMLLCLVLAVGLWSQPAARVTVVPAKDVFTTAAAAYTLSKVPVLPANDVYVNGLLMLQGTDYDLSGTLLTFTGQATAQMEAPIVQVKYWVAQ